MTQRKIKVFTPLPLDIAILKILPDENAKIGKYLWDAKRSLEIVKTLGPEGLNSDIITGRLRQMRGYGLVIDMPVVGSKGGGRGWQRTEAGKRMTNSMTELP
jgi:hypothetical protein